MPYVNGYFVPDYSGYEQPSGGSTSIQVGNPALASILPANLSGPQVGGGSLGILAPVANSTPAAVAPQGLSSGGVYPSTAAAQGTAGPAAPTAAAAGGGGDNLLANLALLGGSIVGYKALKGGYNALRGRLAQQFGRAGAEGAGAEGATAAEGAAPPAAEAGAGAGLAPGLADASLMARWGPRALAAGVADAPLWAYGTAAVGPVVGSVIGPKLINAYLPANQHVKDVLGNISAGAGIGSIGFAAGPEVGIPTTIGGAVIGGIKALGEEAIDWLTGGGGGGGGGGGTNAADDLRGAINAAAQRFGQNGQSYVDQFNTYRNLKMINPETKKPYTDDEIASKLGNDIFDNYQAQQLQNQQAAQMQARTTANANAIMAIQSQAAQYFQPYANNILSSGLAEADSLNKMADTLPPAYQAVFRNQATQAISQANRLNSSYMLQASIQPSAMLAQADINAQQRYENEQYQLAQVQAALARNSQTSGFNNIPGLSTTGTTGTTGQTP